MNTTDGRWFPGNRNSVPACRCKGSRLNHVVLEPGTLRDRRPGDTEVSPGIQQARHLVEHFAAQSGRNRWCRSFTLNGPMTVRCRTKSTTLAGGCSRTMRKSNWTPGQNAAAGKRPRPLIAALLGMRPADVRGALRSLIVPRDDSPRSASPHTPDRFTMNCSELRKQISIFLPLSDWRALRSEAARQGVPITELCRRWLEPHLRELRRRNSA